MNGNRKKSSSMQLAARALGMLCIVALPVGGAVSIMASCAQREVIVQAPKQCELQVVTLTVLASPYINPTDQGAARPVQLRLYQLKSTIRMENASFEQIWKKDKDTLQDDLVKVDELSIYPDSRTDVKFERAKDALDVVAVALFRNPKGRSWYTIFELPPDPGKGACGLNVDCPEGGQCDTGPVLNPRYAVWIDQSRVDVGDDHLDDYPEDGGRTQVIHLAGGASSGSPTPAGS